MDPALPQTSDRKMEKPPSPLVKNAVLFSGIHFLIVLCLFAQVMFFVSRDIIAFHDWNGITAIVCNMTSLAFLLLAIPAHAAALLCHYVLGIQADLWMGIFVIPNSLMYGTAAAWIYELVKRRTRRNA